MTTISTINGNPLSVGTAGIEDGAVTTAKIAARSVTREKVAAAEKVLTENLIVGRLELGLINASGNNAISTTRVRTNGYIEFDEDCYLWVKIKTGYKLAFVIYNSDGTLYRDDYWFDATNHAEFGFSVCDGMKVRLCIAYSDDATISDVMAMEEGVTVERHDRDPQNVAFRSLTYGAIRSNGNDITYTSYPNVCRTNQYIRFHHDAIRMVVQRGYSVMLYKYTSGVFDSKTDSYTHGEYVINVDTSKRYRISVTKDNSTALMLPWEAMNAVVLSDMPFVEQIDERDARLAQQVAYTSNGVDSYGENVTLLHFSDLHGDAANLSRITRRLGTTLSSIDAAICTGDFIATTWSNDFTFWDQSGAQNILLALGNHDVIKNTSLWESPDGYATMSESYQRYFAPNIASWGVTYTQNQTYYYKDFGTSVRLIVLDTSYEAIIDDTVQLAWFQSVLADAKTEELAVVVAQHYPPTNMAAIDGAGAWYDSMYAYSQPGRWRIRGRWQEAVDDFMNEGGEFVCWLAGHTHADLLCVNTSYPDQAFIVIDTANPSRAAPYSDTARAEDTATGELFNVIGIDTSTKTVRVVRFGASENMFGQEKKSLCFNYTTLEVLKS